MRLRGQSIASVHYELPPQDKRRTSVLPAHFHHRLQSQRPEYQKGQHLPQSTCLLNIEKKAWRT